MKLPVELFVANISEKQVYYFSSEKLNTNVPHYFICIKRTDDEMLVLVCCTSQFKKRQKFIELRKLPYSTLVWINPEDKNGLQIDSYVDCNSYFDYTTEEFKRIYESGNLEYKGEVSDAHFEQIIIGLKDSPLVEESIKKLI